MAREAYAGYGSALRIAASVRLSEYDRQTLCAFIADVFRKEFGEVEHDLTIVGQAVRRPGSPLDQLKAQVRP